MRRWIALVFAGLSISSCISAEAAPAAIAPAPPEEILGVHHIGITVSNIDDTIAFYSSVVDFDVVERRMIDASLLPAEVLAKRERADRDGTHAHADGVPGPDRCRARGGCRSPQRRSVTGPGYTHICWQTHADNSGYARFQKAGLDMLSRGD